MAAAKNKGEVNWANAVLGMATIPNQLGSGFRVGFGSLGAQLSGSLAGQALGIFAALAGQGFL